MKNNNEILIDEDIKVSFEVYDESILDWLESDENSSVSEEDLFNIQDVLSAIIEDIPGYIDCYDCSIKSEENSNIFSFIIQVDYDYDCIIKEIWSLLEDSKLSGLKFEQIGIDY